MLSSRWSPIRKARSRDGPRSLGRGGGERGAGALLPRRVRTSARDESAHVAIGACADRLRKPLAGTRGRLPSYQVASAALRVKDALDRTLTALGAEDHHCNRHEELSREFPRTRREAMVGASCCTSAVSDSIEVSGSASSSLPWHQAKGSRRLCNHLLLLALVPLGRPSRADAAVDSSGGSATYVDARNGFSLSPPPQWSEGSKSGAAILFKDPEYKFNNLGVTVTPVKIGSLAEFGSVETAAERLISFEKNKESTKAATINHLSTRTVDNMVFYDFDYSLETTRGNKRVVSTVCVSKNKLYIANGQYFCGQACAEENSDKLVIIKTSLDTFAVQ